MPLLVLIPALLNIRLKVASQVIEKPETDFDALHGSVGCSNAIFEHPVRYKVIHDPTLHRVRRSSSTD